jgi:hypothetical protein
VRDLGNRDCVTTPYREYISNILLYFPTLRFVVGVLSRNVRAPGARNFDACFIFTFVTARGAAAFADVDGSEMHA